MCRENAWAKVVCKITHEPNFLHFHFFDSYKKGISHYYGPRPTCQNAGQEYFFLTVGQNNFGNKIPFLILAETSTAMFEQGTILTSIHILQYISAVRWMHRAVT